MGLGVLEGFRGFGGVLRERQRDPIESICRFWEVLIRF
jgi:hypothetical protein